MGVDAGRQPFVRKLVDAVAKPARIGDSTDNLARIGHSNDECAAARGVGHADGFVSQLACDFLIAHSSRVSGLVLSSPTLFFFEVYVCGLNLGINRVPVGESLQDACNLRGRRAGRVNYGHDVSLPRIIFKFSEVAPVNERCCCVGGVGLVCFSSKLVAGVTRGRTVFR